LNIFDLIILFGGAYASTGTITFTKNNKPEIEELQEAGYRDTAKVLVLREIHLQNKPKTR
jgi:hypothetical protein